MIDHPAGRSEFSIISLLDNQAAQDIETLRAMLPRSPFRDDPPHITLLQGIHPLKSLNDQDVLKTITPALNRLIRVEPHIKVSHLSNLAGGPYRITSAVVMAASEDLRREHISLLAHLRGNGFSLDDSSSFYYPHASVRLGVPFDLASLEVAARLFPRGRGISLRGWEILRRTPDQEKRLFYEIK